MRACVIPLDCKWHLPLLQNLQKPTSQSGGGFVQLLRNTRTKMQAPTELQLSKIPYATKHICDVHNYFAYMPILGTGNKFDFTYANKRKTTPGRLKFCTLPGLSTTTTRIDRLGSSYPPAVVRNTPFILRGSSRLEIKFGPGTFQAFPWTICPVTFARTRFWGAETWFFSSATANTDAMLDAHLKFRLAQITANLDSSLSFSLIGAMAMGLGLE